MRILEPKEGDTRVRRGFALFPMTINGETRWLEWVLWEEEWHFWGYDAGWVPKAWLSDVGHD